MAITSLPIKKRYNAIQRETKEMNIDRLLEISLQQVKMLSGWVSSLRKGENIEEMDIDGPLSKLQTHVDDICSYIPIN